MDRPAAEDAHEAVSGLLEPEAARDQIAMILGHLHRARVAEEVGRMKEIDVERVTLDPLPAVEKASQCPRRRIDRDAEERLERMDRAHLIGDGADSADPGDDVDHLVGRPADDQGLEIARRLEDRQASFLHDTVADP